MEKIEKGLLLDVDEFIENHKNQSGGSVTHSLQKEFANKVTEKAEELHSTKITTNGNLASVLQDIAGYTLSPVSLQMPKNGSTIYPMGTINDIQIFVDAAQRWDDNQIHFEIGVAYYRKLKIQNIEGKSENIQNEISKFSGLVKDTHGILI